MSDESDEATLSVQVANQFVNVANTRLKDGLSPPLIASALRHAAANFTAFAAAHGDGPAPVADAFVQEFREMLTYYYGLHGGGGGTGTTGLHRLIDKVKSEQ